MFTQNPQLHTLDDNTAFQTMGDKILLRQLHGEHMTIGYFKYKKGAIVSMHHHANEQVIFILQGKVKVIAGDQEYIINVGQTLIIPPNLPHQLEALEDETIDLDVFSPVREDWIKGTNDYLTQLNK